MNKSRHLTFRVTQNEYTAIKLSAKGIKLSDFIRESLIKNLEPDIAEQLTRANNNENL